MPPEAPPPPPGQAFQHVIPPHPLQTPITPMPAENVVPPPPKVTTYITSSEYREGELGTPQQAHPHPQPVQQQPREEVVRVIITDGRDEIDRRDFYYYRDGAAAITTAWML